MAKFVELTTKQVADLFGVTPQAIRNRVKEGMPVINKGKQRQSATFNSVDVIGWHIDRHSKPQIPPSPDKALDKQQEEARLKHHQANNEALKEAESLNKVLPTRTVIEMCSAGVINCRTRLESIHKKLRNEFPGVAEDVFERVGKLHEDALYQLGEGGIPRGLEERISRNLEEV